MTSWKQEFKKALIDAIIRAGSPVSDKPSFFGWQDFDSTKREYLAEVGVNYEATPQPQESNWEEFMGTFYEGDTTVYGADVRIVALDGQNFHWRYSGNVSDLIQEVIHDEA